ncbi:hypothetical protein RUM44_013750 [Polyplax serrata]|uniref:Uncharacterized protein n=1 Tax=Polyplax serrata TaxID=468196 RepID=A0ABR1BJ54_POLSC
MAGWKALRERAATHEYSAWLLPSRAVTNPSNDKQPPQAALHMSTFHPSPSELVRCQFNKKQAHKTGKNLPIEITKFNIEIFSRHHRGLPPDYQFMFNVFFAHLSILPVSLPADILPDYLPSLPCPVPPGGHHHKFWRNNKLQNTSYQQSHYIVRAKQITLEADSREKSSPALQNTENEI